MQTQDRHIRTGRPMMRMLASILTWALVAGQVVQPVHAVLTPLNDAPIAAKVSAKPNIVYTLDDSGSMQLNYIPEFVISSAPTVAISALTRAGAVAKATVAATATRTAVSNIPVKFLASRFAVAAGIMIKAPMRSTPK